MHECIDEEATYRLLKEKTIYLSRILVLIAILLLGYITLIKLVIKSILISLPVQIFHIMSLIWII